MPNWPDENSGPAILGSTLMITSLALITLITRLYVRASIIRNLGWDVSAERCFDLVVIGTDKA
jgi:hypothetical protein